MKWFERRKEDDYVKRQAYILSNLGLFYIIILALFAVPLLGTFVVILIKGVIDLRFVIVPAAMLVLGLILFLAVKSLRRFLHRIRRDGRQMMDDAQKQSQKGQAVQISVFNGLLSLTLGHPKAPLALSEKPTPKSLPPSPQESSRANEEVLNQLKELVALKNAGEINEHEFALLKAQLIENSCNMKTKQHEP